MSNATKKQMKDEAIHRMKILSLHPNVIQDFETQDVLNSSHAGILFWLTDEQKKSVQKFEEESGNLVYHVIENQYLEIGRMLTLLYVSPYMDEWDRDRKELAAGEPLAYVANLGDEFCSEYGSVGIRPFCGGVRRISHMNADSARSTVKLDISTAGSISASPFLRV